MLLWPISYRFGVPDRRLNGLCRLMTAVWNYAVERCLTWDFPTRQRSVRDERTPDRTADTTMDTTSGTTAADATVERSSEASEEVPDRSSDMSDTAVHTA